MYENERFYPESHQEVHLPQSTEIHFPVTKFGSLSPSLACYPGGSYIVQDKHATNTQSSATGLPNQVSIYILLSSYYLCLA